ncbi:LemA family protein [Thioflexithrix psekupsensis]|uniref:LemA family protein n=1 Tax=Thioflexithrix psekupsensis TaxID=1570016 RepID=A0A251X6P5_9GAMM|nr:LemA family protein [Thioflexithrix psekupsensis]OUD13267.1 hypothetical protein TPSD3_11595 [Thioflexithrix psekupsensis]
MTTFLWVLLGLGFIIFYIVYVQNRLVILRNRFKNAFSQIDIQLKRRYDLIPNLVETARAYMTHERETLEAVTKARQQAVQASQQARQHPDDAAAIQALVSAETILTGSMGRLFALSENYPELRADQSMAQVMEELTSTENRIAFARQHYNDSVMIYNSYREQFPQALFAQNFGFREAEFFRLETPEARNTLKISFR